ncbi:MAG: hypothetical protein ACM3RX_07140 [Methanococcaceae archaeon]
MARVYRNMFGISGKLGDKIYRIMNGKTFVTRRPESYKIPMDQASIERRTKFSICQKMSHAVNSIPSLKLTWRKYYKKGALSAKIFSSNYSRITLSSVDRFELVPRYNFIAKLKSMNADLSFIRTVFQPLGTGSEIWDQEENQVALYGVLTLMNELTDIKLKYLVTPLASLFQKTSLEAELEFELQVPAVIADNIKNFTSVYLHLVMVTVNIEGMPVKNSNTIYQQISLQAAP